MELKSDEFKKLKLFALYILSYLYIFSHKNFTDLIATVDLLLKYASKTVRIEKNE